MRVYDGDPFFVPELDSDLLKRTDPEANPFFRHAEVDHLVAVREGRDVGRIAAIRNRLAEEFRADRTGYFGWFECADDRDVAGALFDEARARLRARGCTSLLGPVSYSTNDACGLLVEGDAGPPVLMMSYNPPWYPGLVEGAGFAPAEDLLAWRVEREAMDPDRLEQIVRRSRDRHGWSIRPIRMARFAEELETIRTVYNRAWERNWGFVPMTEEEFRFAAGALRSVVVPDLVLVAESRGAPIAFSLSLPDFNQVLARLGGSLFPFGWLKALRAMPRVRGLRVMALGVLPEVRNHGVDAGLYLETFRRGIALGHRWAECSWTLKRNEGINRVLDHMGAKVYRRYRLYSGST